MGLTRNTTVTLDSGAEINNAYISIESLQITKKSNVAVEVEGSNVEAGGGVLKYEILVDSVEHISREKKIQNFPKYESLRFSFDVDSIPADINLLYSNAYNEIKTFFPDVSDVLE
jgi:hypothetical protein